MMTTLECGAPLSEETLKPAINQAGLIDLGKVGCSTESSGHRPANFSGPQRRDKVRVDGNRIQAGASGRVFGLLTQI
ncbi:hypothetical protein [Bradyrhizobium archetypum]|uniref:Uncharacterized protein n=1 Tax=Bradyrhizobium archetypum TaxID=2721160 RepID=A0A7Y4H9F6_9BRAD|nr:hypothetical protein [Bradyrhizobium archetypum]NOJ50109.1 hypothetical protein [Bradyrhizobium archetypum]